MRFYSVRFVVNCRSHSKSINLTVNIRERIEENKAELGKIAKKAEFSDLFANEG